MNPAPQTIDAYIAGFPEAVRAKLQAIREAARAVVPQAEERIAYGIPTLKQGKNLFHFAAFANHLGLYPGSAALEVFAPELGAFKTAKGTIQIPLDAPLPLDLVERLVRFNLERLAVKAR